jgi:hypothetical protein
MHWAQLPVYTFLIAPSHLDVLNGRVILETGGISGDEVIV